MKINALLYVLLGTLLRKLDNGMRGVSHVFVDEIHERDLNVSIIKFIPRPDISWITAWDWGYWRPCVESAEM